MLSTNCFCFSASCFFQFFLRNLTYTSIRRVILANSICIKISVAPIPDSEAALAKDTVSSASKILDSLFLSFSLNISSHRCLFWRRNDHYLISRTTLFLRMLICTCTYNMPFCNTFFKSLPVILVAVICNVNSATSYFTRFI